MMYSLPYTVEIDGEKFKIRNNCDFRVVLDAIEALNDEELPREEQFKCALYIFYGDEINRMKNFDEAVRQMLIIINGGKEEKKKSDKPSIMDWQHDFPQLAPPVSRVLGYDPRIPDRFTHWFTFLGGYNEIGGDCTFATIISIRSKRAKGKQLDKGEHEFYRENRELIDLPQTLSKEEQEFLDSDW